MILSLTVVTFFLVPALGQEVLSDCPSPNGFFADAAQCDKYYHCVDNVLTEKLCPDGMGFNDLNPRVEKCDFLFQVSCDGRPELQRPKPTENCPREFGYFPHEDPTNCREFFYCTGGVSSKLTCPESLTFSTKSGTCVWPEEAGRTNCASEKVYNFTCPKVGLTQAVAHPRYVDPEDCQYFYVCINGDTPRRNGCAFGQVFNGNTSQCDNPKDVPDCADYYTEYFDNYFATLNGPPSGDILSAAQASGYDVPTLRDRVRIRPGSQRPTRRGSTTPGPSGGVPGRRPLRRRRPGGPGGLRRRRPTTTTTTTTTTPAPDYYYYYYDDQNYDYYDDANSTSPATY